MELSNKYKRTPCGEVVINRDTRQRRQIHDAEGKFINKDGLLESIQQHGVMSPILITKSNVLVFGERRLQASLALGLADIPSRFVEDLSKEEAKEIELEENLRRSELPWQDEVRSVAQLHDLYKSKNEKWTRDDTAQRLNYHQVPEALRVAKDIDSPRIAEATSCRQAWNILQRQDERKIGDALSDIVDAGADIFTEISTNTITVKLPEGVTAQPQQKITPSTLPQSILNVDFTKWAPSYEGPKFNFIHCDFPYGIDVFAGKMSGRDRWQHYGDEASVYIDCIKALCQNLDRLMAHSGHLMFWCAADLFKVYETVKMFHELAPSLIFNEYPLIWMKSDNVGILPDPQRGPRRIYETALIASREDRVIVKSTSNAYAAPTNKDHHPSTKPEPMLRYFFQMFVDESSNMFDPTCGSGSSLRAAESLGATSVLGLELDKEHFENAEKALRQFRILRKIAK